MIVDSLMKRRIVTVDADASVRAAAETMRAAGTGSAVVVSHGATVGLITETDLARRVVAERRDPESTRVSEVMSHPIATIPPYASIEEASARMKELGVKRLVVVLEGEVRGILTATDIAYAEPRLTEGLVEGWVKTRWEG